MKELETLANRIDSMEREIQSKKEEIDRLTKKLERWETQGAYETASMSIDIDTEHPYSTANAVNAVSEAIKRLYRAELITSVFEYIDEETDANYIHVNFNKNLRIFGVN